MDMKGAMTVLQENKLQMESSDFQAGKPHNLVDWALSVGLYLLPELNAARSPWTIVLCVCLGRGWAAMIGIILPPDQERVVTCFAHEELGVYICEALRTMPGTHQVLY